MLFVSFLHVDTRLSIILHSEQYNLSFHRNGITRHSKFVHIPVATYTATMAFILKSSCFTYATRQILDLPQRQIEFSPKYLNTPSPIRMYCIYLQQGMQGLTTMFESYLVVRDSGAGYRARLHTDIHHRRFISANIVLYSMVFLISYGLRVCHPRMGGRSFMTSLCWSLFGTSLIHGHRILRVVVDTFWNPFRVPCLMCTFRICRRR